MKAQSTFLPHTRPTILWLSVWALAALQGVFTLAWVSYRIHLPNLVKQFGFTDNTAAILLLIEALLAIAIEPLVGKQSDRTQQQQGSRFPMIVLGIALASACFVATPALVSLVQPIGAVRWLLPALLLAWGISMSLFRSPALALLKRYASTVYLVQAASYLTLAAGLAGAAMPLAKPLILSLGAPITFTLAAVLLLGVGALLRSINPTNTSNLIADANDSKAGLLHAHSIRHLGLIFGLGLTVTLAFRLTTQTFPIVLTASLPAAQKPLLVGLIFISLGLAAIPAGILAVRFGVQRTMLVGIGAIAGCFILMSFASNPIMAFGIALLLGIAFSLVTNGTLPLVLSLVLSKDTGLAVGLFFSGAALATSLFEPAQSILKQPGIVPFWLGVIALVVAGLCVTVSSAPRLDRH